MTETKTRLDLNVIEQRVCDIASEYLGMPRQEVQPASRLIKDLHCDSLDLIELIMAVEDELLVTIPNDPANAVGKSVFTRDPFRLGDLAEIAYLQQGTGKPERKRWQRQARTDTDGSALPFSQLGGRWEMNASDQTHSLMEALDGANGVRRFRRRSDGMRCVFLPSVDTTIGYDGHDSHPDERPAHTVQLDSFVIDMEPVSTTAYCRFLNSVDATETHLLDWFQLDSTDHRTDQMPIIRSDDGWHPVGGAETLPMVLVSWFGANAYSLWANGSQWNQYDALESFLPSEAQWEYAARGAFADALSSDPIDAPIVCGQHERGNHYEAHTMPMASVHSPIGVSWHGLHHMAGNVWQWCRDWYAADFYQRPGSRGFNPVNTTDSGVRSERGGSWVGPAELCRSSYRRGRVPAARGRCLGFRCISPVESLPE